MTMFKCKNKIWLENISDLFCDLSIIPLKGMNLESQMNALSRLVILVFLILLLLNFKYGILFLLFSLTFIIILYYIQRKNMEHYKSEYYTPRARNCRNTTPLDCTNTIKKQILNNKKPIFNTETAYTWCNDSQTQTLLGFYLTRHILEPQKHI